MAKRRTESKHNTRLDAEARQYGDGIGSEVLDEQPHSIFGTGQCKPEVEVVVVLLLFPDIEHNVSRSKRQRMKVGFLGSDFL